MAKRYNPPHTPLSVGLVIVSLAMFLGAVGYVYAGVNSTKTIQDRFFTFLLIWFSAYVPAFASIVVRGRHAKRVADESREALRHLAESNVTMPAQEFLTTLDKANGRGGSPDFTGVYVLSNSTKGSSYVGQSVHVLQRVTQHLTGHGNGDVYADYKYGDSFTVCLIPLVGSGYQSLNDLERDMIDAYDSYVNGYNRRGGNST